MSKIKLITPPDIIHNDDVQMLVLYPSLETQKYLQYEFLGKIDFSVNLYYYDKERYNKEEIDWLLNVFNLCEVVLVDVDNVAQHTKDLLGYFIAKSKTYWLTNASDSVYTHISNNRVYALDFLKNLGGKVEGK